MKDRNTMKLQLGSAMLAAVLSGAVLASGTVEETETRARQCSVQTRNASAYHACLLKATPKKCRHLVSARHHQFYSAQSQKQFFLCLRSCDEAGTWSRTMGECSRLGTTVPPGNARR
jgi:hypothetical protein